MAKVLIACEESQAVCIEMRKAGHEAYSCDLQECSGGHPEWHYNQDVMEIINGGGWELMIAHPPCTYLSHAGNGYFNVDKYGEKANERKRLQIEAAEFFMKLYNAPIPKICIENPIGYMNSRLPISQIIQPYYFGDPDKKTTCLWLKNLPLLYHNKVVNLFDQEITHVEAKPIYIDKSGKKRYFTDAIGGSNKDSKKLRSKTFPGIAKAMAEQWGKLL